MAEFFEDIEASVNTETRKPFWAIDLSNDKTILDWLKQEISVQKNQKWMRNEKTKNMLLRYKGIQYQYQRYQPRDMPDRITGYNPQFVAPLIRDAVDEYVSKLTEYKPGIAVIPQSNEDSDKIDAKISKRFLQHLDLVQDFDTEVRSYCKKAKLAGQAFMVVTWNPDLGPMHPMMKLASKQLYQFPQDNVSGTVSNTTGATPSVFIGDEEIRVYSDLDFYFEQEKRWKDVNWGMAVDYVYTENLKHDYPEKAGEINSDPKQRYFDFELFEEKSLGMKTVKYTFWHKRTKYLPNGFQVIFCNDVVLSKGDFPYELEGLNFDRITDVDLEEEANAQSALETTKGYASQFNNLTNRAIKAMNLMADGKWMVQEGSVDKQQLTNDNVIVTVKKGAEAPKLVQGSPVSPDMMNMRDKFREEFYFFNKSNSVVRGEPPPGITAYVALQYMGEQEARRNNTDVVKYNTTIRNLYEIRLKICAQFYKKDDERTMLVLSKDNRWNQMKYDPSSIQKDFAIVLQNQTALPDSKSARTQFILDMGEKFPGLFSNEQIIEMMNLSQSDRFMDEGSAAVRSAEAENELILDGKSIPDPKEYEFLIQHWKVHTGGIQDLGFKTGSSPEVQQAMIDHITATEMLMMDQAKKSPTFAELCMQLPQFPMFFTPPLPPPMMPPPDGVGGGVLQPQEGVIMPQTNMGPVQTQQLPTESEMMASPVEFIGEQSFNQPINPESEQGI